MDYAEPRASNRCGKKEVEERQRSNRGGRPERSVRRIPICDRVVGDWVGGERAMRVRICVRKRIYGLPSIDRGVTRDNKKDTEERHSRCEQGENQKHEIKSGQYVSVSKTKERV